MFCSFLNSVPLYFIFILFYPSKNPYSVLIFFGGRGDYNVLFLKNLSSDPTKKKTKCFDLHFVFRFRSQVCVFFVYGLLFSCRFCVCSLSICFFASLFLTAGSTPNPRDQVKATQTLHLFMHLVR